MEKLWITGYRLLCYLVPSFMLALGVPIVYAIGLSTLASISTQLDFNSALSVVSQKLASGLDSFTLLAIPFLSCLATL